MCVCVGGGGGGNHTLLKKVCLNRRFHHLKATILLHSLINCMKRNVF